MAGATIGGGMTQIVLDSASPSTRSRHAVVMANHTFSPNIPSPIDENDFEMRTPTPVAFME
jgi:hypothetical protein